MKRRHIPMPVAQLAVAAVASSMLLIMLLTLSSLLPRYVMAGETITGDNATLPSGTIVSEDLYAAGRNVTIDGSALRDVNAIAGEFTLNGLINGNLNLAARTVTINGPIGRSIRITAQKVTINSTVGGDAVIFAGSVTIAPNATITGDLILATADSTVEGTVQGSVKGGSNDFNLDGTVSGAVAVDSSNETLPEGNQVIRPESKRFSFGKIAAYYRWFQFLAAIVATFVVIMIIPGSTRNIAGSIRKTPFAALVTGITVFAIVPIALLLLTVTVIGIPLAIIVAMLMISAAYLSQVFAGVAIGSLIANRLKMGSGRLPTLLAGLFGVSLIWVMRILPIPIWNFTVAFVVALAGVGGIVLALYRSARTPVAA
jgi:cytoskeletal protein CcmA (bactofilin family)